ncbi:MAG: hypothetical protein DI533_03770 [Cereibacter sphaeroides]|uniref:Uncharacterized protein n=1 Tax=Cereibacter sphaeroides TaxID=1063 RepID=A0A2W5SK98_CERSP|nr:MAG: hypothetical protein DI533_03770 [Cereibacter sphaeroides]
MPQLFVVLAFTANGIAFGLMAFGSLPATIMHIQYGTPQNAAILLAIAIVCFVVMLASLLPTARQNLTQAISAGWSRLVAKLFALGLICVVAIAAILAIQIDDGPILGIAKRDIVWPLTGAYIMLIYAVFIFPGLIFWIQPDPRLRQRAMTAAAPIRPAFIEPPPRGLAVRAADVLFGVIALATVLGWGLALKGTTFLPSPEHAAFVAAHRTEIIGATALIFACWGMVMRLRLATKGPFRNRTVHRATTVAIFACGGFLGPLAVEMGLPSFHAMLSGAPPATLEVSVLERGKARESKRCGNTAVVSWPDAAGYSQILCGVPAKIWEGLQPGDRLIVSGPRTRFGQRTDTIVRP